MPRSLTVLLPQEPLQISTEEMDQAWEQTAAPIQKALKVAADNIRAFAKRQLPNDWSYLTSCQGSRPGKWSVLFVPSAVTFPADAIRFHLHC